ncbi:portal protein 3 [Peptoclostridium acidaminophilum DSM 3953]|uniref:Portal protein 3 n=2 Tax=Peptoclostridium acidaminophilum TaxID=1731 RepID=W8TJJ6_PEPAC|nr:portal protein 3 [Peptoclostridium acidaminophilum DSM 3953]
MNKIKNFVKGIMKKVFRNEVVVQEWEQPLVSIMQPVTSSGETITPAGAFGGLGVVFACVERRANALAKLPLQVYRKSGEKRERDSGHRASYLLEKRPNSYQTPSQFKKFIITSQLLWGNAYVRMKFSGKKIVELIPINPAVVRIVKDKGKYWFVINSDGKQEVLSEDEIIHLPYLSIDGKVGKAPLTVASENAGNLQAMQKFEGNFYKNGTLRKGALKIPASLDAAAKKKLKLEWRELYGGVSNTGDVAVLDGGIEWQDISIPLKDAEFVVARKLNNIEIANIFNVPSFMLNDMERSTYNNVEQQNMRFIMDVIQPDCIAMEEEFNYKLFLEREDYYVKFNLTSALRGDTQTRANYYKEMIGIGVLTINDVRRLEEMNDIGEYGDKHYFSLNYTTLETLEEHERIKNSKGGEGNT